MLTFPQNDWLPIFQNLKSEGKFDIPCHILAQDLSKGKTIYPPMNKVFQAFEYCPLSEVKLVLLGQDPYHGEDEANGLSFSVNNGVKTPPSLKNIFKEISSDYADFDSRRSTDLSDWAQQGVLLLNTILTVEKDQAASHRQYGWEAITDSILREISARKSSVIFLLLGQYAQSKTVLIDPLKHKIIATSHPSPLGAYKGFMGSGVFRQVNNYLALFNTSPIKW